MSVSQLMGSISHFARNQAEGEVTATTAGNLAPGRPPRAHTRAERAAGQAPTFPPSPLDLLGNVVGDADVRGDVCRAAREEHAREQSRARSRELEQRVMVTSANGPGARMVERLNFRWTDKHTNRAIVLTGNMYLASEWATSTKAGEGVIISDDKGVRHRAIMLNSKFKPEFFAHLPRRLWMPDMLSNFVKRIHEEFPAGQTCRMFTDFSSAWSDVSTVSNVVRKGAIAVTPGEGITVHYSKEQLRRVNASLRSAQKSIKEKKFDGVAVPAGDDPDHVVISTPKAGRGRAAPEEGGSSSGAGIITLKADTPAKMARAIEMFVQGPGLELFVTVTDGTGRLKQIAAECAREYFERRLRTEAEADPARMAKVEALLAGGYESDDDNAAVLAELGQLQQALLAQHADDEAPEHEREELEGEEPDRPSAREGDHPRMRT